MYAVVLMFTRERRSSRRRRRSINSSENMPVSREPSFVYFKGKTISSSFSSKSFNRSLHKFSFCTSNLWSVLFSSLLRASTFVASHQSLCYAYAIRRNAALPWTREPQLAKPEIMVYYVLNKDIFRLQMHEFASEGRY